MSEAKSFTVSVEGSAVDIKIIPNEFVFADFDSWLRSRCGLMNADKLLYLDVDNNKGPCNSSSVSEIELTVFRFFALQRFSYPSSTLQSTRLLLLK